MKLSVRCSSLLLPALAAVLPPCLVRAQTTVTTTPVGYVQLACTGSADTVVSVPFMQPAAYAGMVQSVSANVVTISGTPAFTSSQYIYSGSGSNTYFAMFGPAASGSDPKTGACYTITANGTNTLTLALNGDTISSVPAGSAISIVPYWTISTVFPASNEISVNPSGSFEKSTSTHLNNLKTQILIPDYGAAGTDISTANRYYFYNGAWVLFGDTNPAHVAGDDVLINNGYFLVRNNNAPTTTLTTMGTVVTGTVTVPLSTEAAGYQDNPVSLARPVAYTLNETGLGGSAAFTTSTTTHLNNLADQLLLYSGSSTTMNPSLTTLYYYYQGHWAMFSDPYGPSTDHGSDPINAGTGFVIRKAGNLTGATVFWQNASIY